MSAEVIPISTPTALNQAWDEYAEHTRQAIANPALLVDREWVQRRAILNRRFDRLYLLTERR